MSVLEKVHETQTSEYARGLGCLVLKLNVIGRKGWPDRIYIYKGKVLFIEFKREGERVTRLQEIIHDKLRGHGIRVEVVDNYEEGRAIIHQFTSGG